MASRGLRCARCGSFKLTQDADGFYVCDECFTQSQDYVEQELDQFDAYTNSSRRKVTVTRTQEDAQTPAKQAGPSADKEEETRLEDAYPGADGTFLNYFQDLLLRQVEALVSECGVSPLLPGVVRKLWFHYLTTRQNQVANNDAYRARLNQREKKRDRAVAANAEAASQQEAATEQDLEQSKTWLDEMGLTSLLSPSPSQPDEAWLAGSNDDGSEEQTTKPATRKRKRKRSDDDDDDELDGGNGGRMKKEKGSEDDHQEKEKEKEKEEEQQQMHKVSWRILETASGLPQVAATLTFNYVACNILQEPIVALDLVRWARSGRLPFEEVYTLKDFKDTPGKSVRPMQQITSAKLEYQAISLIEQLGIEQETSPPFYPTLFRFIEEVHLPPSLGLFVHHIFELPSGKAKKEAKIMKWLYGRATHINGPFMTERVVASIVVALKLVYGCVRDKPAHPHDQYRSFLFRQSVIMHLQQQQQQASKRSNSGSPSIMGLLPWHLLPAPSDNTLLNEMPPFEVWKHTMRNLVYGPLPRGQIPYFGSDFWRMGPHNVNDFAAYTQSLWGQTPTRLKPVEQQLQAIYATSDEEEASPSLNSPRASQSKHASTSSTSQKKHLPDALHIPPVLAASEYVTYDNGKTSIEDWQRAGLHHNYRAIIELLAAFYELRPFHLHTTVVSLEHAIR